MVRSEATGSKKSATSDPGKKAYDGPLDAYSVDAFCEAHSISVALYYKLRAIDPNLVPREFEAGTRRLISREAAADWRREREAATAAKLREAASEAGNTST